MIQPRALHLAEDAEGPIRRHGPPIGAIRREGLVDVCGKEDPLGTTEFIGTHSPGVAGPVEAFVVEARHAGDVGHSSRAMTSVRERIGDQFHTALRSAAPPTRELDPAERARVAEVVRAVREVETALEVLSEASLRG